MSQGGAGPEEEVFHERLDWKLWRQVFDQAWPHRRYLLPLAISAVVIALIDASFTQITRKAIDMVEAGSGWDAIFPWIILFGVLTGLLASGVWLFINMAGKLSCHMGFDIRRKAFEKIQDLEISYFDHRPTGWLISRLTSDCDKLSRIIAWGCLDLVWASSLILVISVFIMIMDWRLGLIILGTMPFLVWVSAVFQKKLLLSSREVRKWNSFITASFSESLQGLKTSRSFGREEANKREFGKLADSMFQQSVRNATQAALFMPLVMTIGSVATGALIWIGGGQVIQEAISLGTLVAFIAYAGQLYDPINQLAMILVQLQGAQAAGERVLGLLATEPAVKDDPKDQQRWSEGMHHPVKQSWDKVEFRQVSFGYTAGQPILENFQLEVAKGETIALVGPSGGGKTTLVSLLSRFYEPVSGCIMVNGWDIGKIPLEIYQSRMGVVLQEPHLFAGTIEENIRYGRQDATREQVEEAAKLVNAHPFIEKMEKGYQTPVGEGGNRLSTGQKQLISFARAILANPALFIMDEATSSIDTESEYWIQEGLKQVFEGRISFVIAHRLSTIMEADRILFIREGKIVESGDHQSLVDKKGAYFDLWQKQSGGTWG